MARVIVNITDESGVLLERFAVVHEETKNRLAALVKEEVEMMFDVSETED